MFIFDQDQPHIAKSTVKFIEENKLTALALSPYTPELNYCVQVIKRWKELLRIAILKLK
jgi:hypothetical protein